MLLIIAIDITFPNLRTFRFKQSASPQCQEQLTRRQKIIAQDFAADVGLIRSCKHEMKKYSCKKVIDKESKNAVKLSQILLCLDSLLRQTQVMMDWRADPVLENGK